MAPFGRYQGPHQAGACLVTEEMFLGKCYKKCSDLTAKQRPDLLAVDVEDP